MDDQPLTQSTSSVKNSLPNLIKQGFSRRRFFRRTAAATGALALAGGSATILTACTNADTNTNANADYNTAVNLTEKAGGTLREYWIQADAFLHNLMPTGVDDMTNTKYPANQSSYWALGYRAYTENWGKLLPGDDNIGPNTGIPGPTFRAEVGDTIRVHFRNNDTYYKFPHSMHAHGLQYTPDNDGAYIAKFGSKPGTAIMPGESYTYEWTVVASSVGTWPYHDHSKSAMIPGSTGTNDSSMNVTSGIMELGAQLGLYGVIAITDSKTTQVDREFILCFVDVFEADIPQLSQDFNTFNGYAFLGNTPTFTAKVGERVRWRVMALGTNFHVFHVHGHRWLYNGMYTDSLTLGPATTLTVEYVEDNPGTWLYHCHVDDHMMGGMVGYYITSK
ncbi:MAG TPA: multicopper oxidase domain-containing protein [Dictyobacter sp.]|nr:multicopper oxidase domain-containing protein [Dictyobacter sp.]